jgi:hypothetical protein
VDGNCDGTTLRDAIKYTIKVAAAEREEIARLAGAGKCELASLVGVWKSRPDGSGALAEFTLQVRQDGTFMLEREFLTFRGTYDAAAGLLRVTVNGKSSVLAAVQSAAADTVVLRLKEASVTLVRRSAASVAGAPPISFPPPLPTNARGD